MIAPLIEYLSNGNELCFGFHALIMKMVKEGRKKMWIWQTSQAVAKKRKGLHRLQVDKSDQFTQNE